MKSVTTAKPFSADYFVATAVLCADIVPVGEAATPAKGAVKSVSKQIAKNVAKSELKNTAEQDIVIQLAKANRNGITRSNAKILVDWAEEYGINNHGPMIHPDRSGIWSYTEHIKIFKYHIPIFPD